MAGFRKRTFASAFKRPGGFRKKGRFNRKRRFGRRAQKGAFFGTRDDKAISFGYRGKKISPSLWKKKLWDSTLQKSHYRVAATWIDTISTPANRSQSQSTIYQAQSNGNLFWGATGGAIDVDGGTIPTFSDDLIIRGGSLSLTVTYVDNTVALGDHCKVKIMLIKGADNINFSGFNGIRDANWDSTMFPEFRARVGKVLFQKEFDLGTEIGTAMTFKRRIGIQKIDTEGWGVLGTGRHYWVVTATNPANNAGTDLTLTFGMSMSFSGDSN